MAMFKVNQFHLFKYMDFFQMVVSNDKQMINTQTRTLYPEALFWYYLPPLHMSFVKGVPCVISNSNSTFQILCKHFTNTYQKRNTNACLQIIVFVFLPFINKKKNSPKPRL